MDALMNDSMVKKFATMPFDELLQAAMPAYQHHFTHAEMQELIQFYSTPLGKKLLAEMPAMMAEYLQAATPVMQKWMKAQMADLKASAEKMPGS